MRGRLRTGIIATAATSAAVATYVALTLPEPATQLAGPPPASHIAGAYHIHTRRSDGTGSVDAVADAARRAGLQFIILTDHGDGTRTPDPPAYRNGVLTIDAVEINSQHGHIVALGLAGAAPYPLAGPARDVIEDIHRLGGAAVIAHPDSPRSGLAWRGSGTAQADGVEWLNADSEWRDDAAGRLIGRALQLLIRPPEAIASLFSRPDRTLRRWDTSALVRPTFGVAALDAHASLGWRDADAPRQRTIVAWPSYDTMFRTITQTVVLPGGLSGNAQTDADRLLDALRAGRSYSTIRAQAWPSVLEFTARQSDATHTMGARLDHTSQGITLEASTPGAPGAQLTLFHNGRPLVVGQGRLKASDVTHPGVYRVEARLPGRQMPWIVSNPITVASPEISGGTPSGAEPDPAPEKSGEKLHLPMDASSWNIESDPTSEGSRRLDDGRLRFDYRLGDGVPAGQYAALVEDDRSGLGIDAIQFVGQASSPMRVSVQVRLPEGRGSTGQRWRRSVYLDATPRAVRLLLRDFEPADHPTARRPIVTPIGSLLFVVDTVNTRPGTSGTIWISDVTLGVSRLE